ncbi:hypothetical protein BG015_000772 [Linnemannia schmuckeri]|uniref:Sel1 repeat family protein n=1 Tax=Linnemannia schmuckeri TaxID=64567 RepID=A0A9P5S7L9_9FUNG|nr:hypothetical protein BG015_000772 [Linnemannia schmuckeri]
MDLVQTIISASHGDKNAQVAVGDMYRDDKGVPQDYQAAMDWYLKAAEQGHADSHYNIGVLYDYGRAQHWGAYDYDHGVSQDYTKAAEWYTKTADQGYELAKKALEDLKKPKPGVAVE